MKWKILFPFVLCSTFTMWFSKVGAEQFYCDYESESDPNDFSMTNQHNHNDLTYKITSYSNKLSTSEVNDVIAEAFNAWSAVTDLTFRKIDSDKPDIDIKFAEQNHGCRKTFDGPRGILGHASKRYVHFDDSENWSTQINSGSVNLYSIAVHEIGHSLGLGHSTFVESIMYHRYRPSNVITKLHRDDIDGIQKLYGAKTTSGNRNGNSGGDALTDCWTTGCQLNTWAVVGCKQYQRVEKSKTACHGGYMYECCIGSSERRPPRTQSTGTTSRSWSECWTTGCQLSSWAVVGCGQYGMTQIEKFSCPGGNLYKCCK
ncbi:hypothetical protein HA402_008343 [Bradysia odoriphaga]|nr:hypothetical protein HA402_008343 [Bradysia odoriphaga]